MNKLNCIKCGKGYQSDDVDPYLCAPCLEQKKAVAAEVDKKFAARPKKTVMSGIQLYNKALKGGRFPNARDLGIKL